MEKEDIKRIVAKYLAEGTPLSEIQTILNRDHQEKMTFLDLRLLASELENVDWSKTEHEEEKNENQDLSSGSDDQVDQGPMEDNLDEGLGGEGRTVVELSKVARPGAVASGSVKFGSGASAEWVLDQLGRLALQNSQGKPTPEDLEQFQMELQKALTGGA